MSDADRLGDEITEPYADISAATWWSMWETTVPGTVVSGMAPDVSAETCVAKQHAGERIDYDHALLVVMQ